MRKPPCPKVSPRLAPRARADFHSVVSLRMKKLFVTGATGFVGKRLLPLLSGCDKVLCLVRNEPKAAVRIPTNVEWIPGALNDPASFAGRLRGVDAVVHLAALTGKAKPDAYEHANVSGTRTLVEAAQSAGVPNFLHVSSVAVKFPDKRGYPYGQSKEAGEAVVRASHLRYAIMRPAIILGAGSPVWRGVAPMLKLPVMPIFGDGQTPIQPIHVDDVAMFLRQILQQERFRGETLEFGGPEVLSFEELLQRAREKRSGKRAPVVHIPLAPLTAILSLLEPLLFSMLPITVGQLSSFRYSGVMDANALWEESKSRLKPVREMLE